MTNFTTLTAAYANSTAARGDAKYGIATQTKRAFSQPDKFMKSLEIKAAQSMISEYAEMTNEEAEEALEEYGQTDLACNVNRAEYRAELARKAFN